MKRQLLGLVLLSLLAVGCSSGQTIVNYEKSAITSNATLEDIAKNIEFAVKSVGWRVDEKKPGEIVASLQNRSHHVVVAIQYDKTNYSIHYKDSTNLDYNPSSGRIHKKYNKWVAKLDRAIRARL